MLRELCFNMNEIEASLATLPVHKKQYIPHCGTDEGILLKLKNLKYQIKSGVYLHKNT